MSTPEPTFTTAQISRYFDHVGLPRKYYAVLEPGASAAHDLDTLQALHVHHIAAIAYENLNLHYSASKTVSLDPHDLYSKFLERGCNRGGYCVCCFLPPTNRPAGRQDFSSRAARFTHPGLRNC